MEKSLKKTISSCIDLSNINFGGFSRSKYWVGYFYYSNDFGDRDAVKNATKAVRQFFGEEFSGFFLLSGMAFDDEDEIDDKEIEQEYLPIYQYAKDIGLLQPYSESWEKYDESEIFTSDLIRLHFNSEDFLPICEMVMEFTFRQVVGQVCFLIHPRLNIAIYPHDDVGFGCISLDGDHKLALEFLQFCGTQEGFSVIFKENRVVSKP